MTPAAATAATVFLAERSEPALFARAGLWRAIATSSADTPRILILVDLGGFEAADPAVVEPRRVEALIDLIHANCSARVDLAASNDSSCLWAGNRDIYALAELLGYRFRTDAGHDYDLVDLGAETVEGMFPIGSVLHGSPASAEWLAADVRINLARLHPHEAEGFTAGLMNLIGALPLPDKALHYRHRRDSGAVIAVLLHRMPPHFTLIDASRTARGRGRRRPSAATGAGYVIASACPLLADYAAALKLGLDPFDSPLVARVARDHPLPPRRLFIGSLKPFPGIAAPSPLRQRATQARAKDEFIDRLLVPWLNQRDENLFPAIRPLDARAHALLAPLVGRGDSASGNALLLAVDLAAGAAANLVLAWKTLFAKDALIRRVVPLDLDLERFTPADFEAMTEDLDALASVAASAPRRGEGLRWRKAEEAVVFKYVREVGIPFDRFVAAVDVARTISFMNDYLGGVVVPIETDAAGRPLRQAERNLYLPQPNYLILYGGKPIDVTKIEVARYGRREHRLYWKTVHSANGSATADDGRVTFRRTKLGTRITIIGKQRFVLPPFWQLFDVALIPELEAILTTHAYQTFFDRTLNNFEGLVEGREIQIGRSADEAAAHPSILVEQGLARLMENAGPWLDKLPLPPAVAGAADAAGFVHVVPAP